MLGRVDGIDPFCFPRASGCYSDSNFKGVPTDSPRYSVILYLVRASPSGLTKIGVTGQWDARLSAIRRGNSEHVEVLKIYGGSDDDIRELEKELHLELSGSCDHHEWFQLTDSELQQVLIRLERQFNPENYFVGVPSTGPNQTAATPPL